MSRVTKSKTIDTTEMNVGQTSKLVIPTLDSPIAHAPDEITVVDGPTGGDYAEDLAFMEERVIVLVHETSDENAAPLVDVYVNGVAQFFPRGVDVTCKRKYVEGLVRAKPIHINTQVTERNSENPKNEVLRRSALRYPFSIVRDDNPKGRDWLRKILAEA
jgi:hypothetical protein